MLAGEMEKREYVEEGLVQLCSEERFAGGGEKYLEAAAALLAELSLPALGRKDGSAEKSSSHSKAPPVQQIKEEVQFFPQRHIFTSTDVRRTQ